ncbi:hypothetical protein WA026_022461 [Henosepilachna vigintioctopunctata]|uniref:C2H2-type domain-containing protein n=1 Tax=Henosepilachna vigintioctopunctata TaxID=420089 RepID=A0AAW1TPE2_9CUCU
MFEFRKSSIINDMQLKANAEKLSRPVLHETVEILLKKYPRIILPPSIAKTNISPVVIIDINASINSKTKTQEAKKYEKTGNFVQLVTESTSQNDEFEDIENEIMPYLIPNKEIPVRSDTPNQTKKVSSTLSSDIPKLTLEIVEKQKQSEVAEILESTTITKKKENKAKKRLSEAQSSEKTKKYKSNADFDSGDNSVESLVTLKYVTKSLSICDICNGILYSAKDLKKHKMRHMKCNLCKKTFRSLEETKRHKDSECVIKRIMNNLPTIILEQCNQSEELRKRYPLIFNGMNERKEKKDFSHSLPVDPQIDCPQEPVNKFEEDEITKVQHHLVYSDVKSEECTTEVSPISYNENESNNNLKCNNPTRNDFKNHFKNHKPRTVSNDSVKPDIDIIGKNTFDVNLDDDEVDVLKCVLKKTKNNIKDTCAQTDIPCNADIEPCLNENKLFFLKNFRKFLSFNKVPVNLSFSPEHSIKFSSEPCPLLKKGGHWSTHVTKMPVSSETLPVNTSPENTIQNNVQNQIINNTNSPSLSTNYFIENEIPSNNLFLDVPSDVAPQSNVGNLQIQPNSGATFLLPTILPATGNYPQINNTFSIAGQSILGALAVINPNFSSTTDLNNFNQNSNLLFQNNSTSNNILLKNITGEHALNIQTPQFIQTSCNGYSRLNSSINITNEITGRSTNNLFVGPQPKGLLIITPTTTNSQVLSSTPSQNKFDSPTYVNTSYSKTGDNSSSSRKE